MLFSRVESELVALAALVSEFFQKIVLSPEFYSDHACVLQDGALTHHSTPPCPATVLEPTKSRACCSKDLESALKHVAAEKHDTSSVFLD